MLSVMIDQMDSGLIRQRATDGDVTSLALLSPGRLHRLLLMSEWPGGDTDRMLVAVMLNPSRADAVKGDATMRRVEGYARREGCSGVLALNLFTFRTRDPRKLMILTRQEAVDHRADEVITDAFRNLGQWATTVMVAWGAHAAHPNLAGRRDQVVTLLDQLTAGAPLWCLGTTKTGEPVHPLYQRADAPLVEWLAL